MSHLKAKSFSDYINKAKAEKEKPFRDALLFARTEARSESGIAFVKSCEEQFKRKGYLTQKQVAVLYAVDSRPSFSYRADEDDYDYPDPNFGLPNFDEY